jgi:hypothetical protein
MYGQRTTDEISPTGWRTARFRWAGLIPLLFFTIRLVDYLRWHTPAHIWWSCHIANLTLGLGMLLRNVLLMRVAVLWLILGLPPWLLDMFATHIIWPISLLTHLGGAVFGLLVVRQVRMVRGVWWAALLWYLGLQLWSRVFTAPGLNVNAAHTIYEAARPWFSRYWLFWLMMTVAAGVLLWLLELGLVWAFPADGAGKTSGKREDEGGAGQ